MQTLIVIPSLMHKYTFSAPIAWLFSDHADQVKGIYSFALTKDIVKEYDRFILELNWFIELCEFELSARFIKRHNKKAVILFGGMYSQLKYQEILKNSPVDYFIKGDNELPIKQFLDGADPRTIPNMVGRDFENEQTYIFQQKDYRHLEFNLDWFPDYTERWKEYPEPDQDLDPCFAELPFLPSYWEKPGRKLPLELRWRVPPKGGRYHLPMLITGRGGCLAAHKGCDYCMGSKADIMYSIYRRPTLIIDNDTMIHLLKKIEKRFDKASIYINSECNYDFTGHHFDLEATIEIDSRSTLDEVRKIIPAFRKAYLHTALYQEGLVGSEVRTNIDAYREIEDQDHKVYFFAFPQDAKTNFIPNDRRLYSECVLPPWTDWNFYNDRAKALARSRSWYQATGQLNLYPLPRQIGTRIIRFFVRHVAYVLNKLGIIHLRETLL